MNHIEPSIANALYMRPDRLREWIRLWQENQCPTKKNLARREDAGRRAEAFHRGWDAYRKHKESESE